MENVYSTFVPHIYIPEPSVMGVMLKSVEASGLIEYIPKLWSDMTVFEHTSREDLVQSVFEIMVNNIPANVDLPEKFATIGWDFYNQLQNSNRERKQQLGLVFLRSRYRTVMILLFFHV